MPSSVPMHIDSSCDVISVVRRDSEIWKRNASILQADMPALLSFCRKKGKTDDKRRDSSTARILEFGSTTGTKTVYGNQHFHNNETSDRVRQTLGNLVDFIWLTCTKIQLQGGFPLLGGNATRFDARGKGVSQMLGCKHSEFEAVTVSSTILSSKTGNCNRHKDVLNDDACVCSKTGALNVVMACPATSERPFPDLHLLQVICNFRRRENLFPDVTFEDIKKIVERFKSYHHRLRAACAAMFKNSQRQRLLMSGSSVTDFTVNPSDMNAFHVDENLDWKNVKLAKKHSPLSQQMTISPTGAS